VGWDREGKKEVEGNGGEELQPPNFIPGSTTVF